MAVYIVTSQAAEDASGLTLSAAVERANATAEDDVIRFAEGVETIEKTTPYVINPGGGRLVVDGDRDGDGVSDVLIDGSDSRAMTVVVEEGADLTVRNVDFIGGRIGSGVGSGRRGEDGENGAAAEVAEPFGIHGGDGKTGESGTPGGMGEQGPDAAAILNRGSLVLERVGFADIEARATPGGTGGDGGHGGPARGGDGLEDTNAYDTPAPPLTENDYGYRRLSDARNDVLPFAGNGGAGGVAGSGAFGGTGGRGGDAAVVLNDTGATLTLTDVVFGGRLSSGVIGTGNLAQGGAGGRGGEGGQGAGAYGGNGANGGIEWSYVYYDEVIGTRADGSPRLLGYVSTYYFETTRGGLGGDAGTPGAGGRGGEGGLGGDGGMVVNRGTAEGLIAAAGSGPGASETLGGAAGIVGEGGGGGRARGGEGGQDRHPSGLYLGSLSAWEYYGGHGEENVARYQAWLDTYRAYPAHDHGVHGFIFGLADTYAADGASVPNGPDGPDGEEGATGTGELVVDGGTGSVGTGSALVYIHGGGAVAEGEALEFTIARLGDISAAAVVNWELVGTGGGRAAASDFIGSVSGSVTLGAAATPGSDGALVGDDGNVARIRLQTRDDGVSEGNETWRIEITSVEGAGVSLGTSVAEGRIVDGEASGPITGTPGDDTLDGGEGADLLRGLAGADVLRGHGGDDTLEGGDGPDTLNGGDGDDLIRGGDTEADRRDVIYGGDGNDSIDGGYGNDLIFGQGGNDTLAGGFGADELQGQDGDDVITGSAFGDIVFGNAGDDFVNGGFGHDLINGGTGADKFFHTGGTREQMEGHGSDWVQDYSSAEGDVLVFGGAGTADQFQVNLTHTANKTTGERSGDDDVQEAFVIYKPTGQILWALVDGGGQASINLQIGAEVFDLLA